MHSSFDPVPWHLGPYCFLGVFRKGESSFSCRQVGEEGHWHLVPGARNVSVLQYAE